MTYVPPFTIAADILNLVAGISEQVGQLNAPVNASVNAPVNIAGLKAAEALVLLLQHNPQNRILASSTTNGSAIK